MIQPVHDAVQGNNGSEILSQCLQALEAGETTIESCIVRFPNFPELPLLLHTMTAVQELPRPLLPAVNKALMREQMITVYRAHWPVGKYTPQPVRYRIPRWLQFTAAVGFLASVLALLISSITPSINVWATPTENAFAGPTMTLTLSPTTTVTRTPIATATLTETSTTTLTSTASKTATFPQVGMETTTPRPAITAMPTRIQTSTPVNRPAIQPTKREAPSKTTPTPGIGNNNSNSNGGQGSGDKTSGQGKGKDKK